MTTAELEPCHYLIPVLLGEASEVEYRAFQRHLQHCTDCSAEFEALKSVWEVIPYQMQDVPLPPDLKQQVMQSVIGSAKKKNTRRRARWTYGLAAALLAIVLIGSYWSGTTTSSPFSGTSKHAAETASLVKTFDIRSDAMANAVGKAWMFEYSDMSDIIVSLEGLAPPPEGMSYQVWLVDGESYFNCGTLQLDDNGAGVLAYKVSLLSLPFSSVEVTLEANTSDNLHPYGEKVMGASQPASSLQE